MKKMTKKYKRNIGLDYLVTIFRSFNLTGGVWIAYLGVIKGFSLTEIGLLEGIFHIASLTSEIPTGMYADIIGRKQSRMLSAVVYLSYILIMIYAQSFYVMVIGLVLCGVSYTFESGSGEALIYDSLLEMKEEEKYQRFLGNKEVLFQIASSLALVIGGYLATVDYTYNFVLTGVIMTLVLIPLFFMKEVPIDKKNEEETFKKRFELHFVDSFKTVLKDKNLLFLIVSGGILSAPVTTIFFYLQVYLPELKFTMFHVGILLAVHAFFGAMGGLLAPWLEKKFKVKLILYVIPLLMIAMYFLIQIDSIVFVPFVLLGFLDSMFYVVLNDYINKLVPSDKRATLLSFESFSFSIIMIILFPVVGYLGDLYTLKYSFLMMGLFVVLFYLILLYVMKKSPNITLNDD